MFAEMWKAIGGADWRGMNTIHLVGLPLLIHSFSLSLPAYACMHALVELGRASLFHLLLMQQRLTICL